MMPKSWNFSTIKNLMNRFRFVHLLLRVLGYLGPTVSFSKGILTLIWAVFESFCLVSGSYDINSCPVKAVVFNRWILWWFRCKFTVFSCSFWTIFWNRDFVALLLVFGSTLTLERQELKQFKNCSLVEQLDVQMSNWIFNWGHNGRQESWERNAKAKGLLWDDCQTMRECH